MDTQPIKEDRRKKYDKKFAYKLEIRMTEFEKKRLFLKLKGVKNRQKLLKDLIFNKEVVIQKSYSDERIEEIRAHLPKIGNNLNQIARSLNINLGNVNEQEQDQITQQLHEISNALKSLQIELSK